MCLAEYCGLDVLLEVVDQVTASSPSVKSKSQLVFDVENSWINRLEHEHGTLLNSVCFDRRCGRVGNRLSHLWRRYWYEFGRTGDLRQLVKIGRVEALHPGLSVMSEEELRLNGLRLPRCRYGVQLPPVHLDPVDVAVVSRIDEPKAASSWRGLEIIARKRREFFANDLSECA